MKYLKAVLATALYFCVLVGAYVVHARFLPVDVVFYSALQDMLLAVSLMTVLLFCWPRLAHEFGGFEKAQLVAIWLLAGYALAISVPTVIDRSLSFYVLEKLQQRGGAIKLANFESVFRDEYMKEHRLVDVRLTEQQASGTIVIKDGCVFLTERGRELAAFSRYFRRNFLPRHRLLMGDYTADLTDPFRAGTQAPASACGS